MYNTLHAPSNEAPAVAALDATDAATAALATATVRVAATSPDYRYAASLSHICLSHERLNPESQTVQIVSDSQTLQLVVH